jgi:hypothetical protein
MTTKGGATMKKCKYAFTRAGVKALEHDSLDLILSALDGENKDFDISELNFKITIGNLETEIPCLAHNFEAFFDALAEVARVDEEEA